MCSAQLSSILHWNQTWQTVKNNALHSLVANVLYVVKITVIVDSVIFCLDKLWTQGHAMITYPYIQRLLTAGGVTVTFHFGYASLLYNIYKHNNSNCQRWCMSSTIHGWLLNHRILNGWQQEPTQHYVQKNNFHLQQVNACRGQGTNKSINNVLNIREVLYCQTAL